MPNGINRSINCVSVLEATNDSQRHAISSEETYKRNKEGSKNKTHGIFPVANSPRWEYKEQRGFSLPKLAINTSPALDFFYGEEPTVPSK